MRGKRKAREYSAEEKNRGIERGLQVGPAQAARELGIPGGTLRCWVSVARKKARGGAPQAASQAARESGNGSTCGAETTAALVHRGKGSLRGDGEARKARRVARVYTPSEKARALELVAVEGVSGAHRRTGISRFTLYDWCRRAKTAVQVGGAESPVGGSDTDPRAERDRRILAEWRQHPGLGPSQIRNQLRRQGFKVSVHTTRRVMEENGYVLPKVKRETAQENRYEAIRPNQLWHVDFLHRYVHKQSVYVLFLVDDFSRFLVGAALWDGERADAVIETFEQAVSRHGRPETMMSDGGPAFYAWRGVSRFTRLLEELGVDQLIARHPRVNGKCEILNATVAKELFTQERFFDLGEARRRLEAWVTFYNLRRTHHALGGVLVPADRYFGRSEEVLGAIEAGASGEGIGELLPVNERHLDLVKVASHRGCLELWFMGRRLWPAA